DLARWLDGAWNRTGGSAQPGDPISTLSTVGQTSALRLEPRPCRSFLIVTPGAQASIPIMARYRVVPTSAASSGGTTTVALEPGTPAYGTSSTLVTPSDVSAVRLEIRSASVAAQTPSGGSWDIVGGAP